MKFSDNKENFIYPNIIKSIVDYGAVPSSGLIAHAILQPKVAEIDLSNLAKESRLTVTDFRLLNLFKRIS